MRHARSLLRAVAVALALAGAGSGPAQGPTYGPPAGVDNSPLGLPPPAIPPDLARAAARAVETYPAIAAAVAGVRASEFDVRAARWQRYPSASAEAFSRDDRIGSVTPDIRLVQPVWTGGRIGGTIDRSKAQRSAAIAALEETRFDILLRLAGAYYEIVQSDRLAQIYAEGLADHERLVASMERRVAQKVSPRADLELARSRTAQVRQDAALAIAQRSAALTRFLNLVGTPTFEFGAAPAYDPARHHSQPDDAAMLAVECDATIRRLRAQVGVAGAERRIAKSATYPEIGVQYAYNPIVGNQVGLVMRAQVNGGLSAQATAQAAAARMTTAQLQVATAERAVREAVALDLAENDAARSRITASSAAAVSSANVTASFLRQFVAGRRTWLDVMNAVREATTARITLTQAEIAAMASAARLTLRTCRWGAPASDAVP